MIWNVFSFFLSNEEPFLEFNTNILETNAINLFILIGLLLYGNKVSFQPSLEKRQQEIIITIENAQKDVVSAAKFYATAEKGLSQNIFWLQAWQSTYQKDKIDFVNNKYKRVKNALLDTFSSTENFIRNFETRSFLNLQRYILYIIASRVLRKFLLLSENEQSKVIEATILALGGDKK
jgi:hypothetical protein